MLLHSALVFSFLIFNGPILALPGIHSSSESSSGTSSLLNRQLLSKSSSTPPLSHQREKRAFGRKPKEGIKCDKNFYKKTRVEAIATGLCNREKRNPSKNKLKYEETTNKVLSKLFPNRGPLVMIRIKNSFFSLNALKYLLSRRRSLDDFVVIEKTEICKPVGIVTRDKYGYISPCPETNPN
ncbi:hypothetical protein OnM2_101038, partial [Erysiphe neolycopersici]